MRRKENSVDWNKIKADYIAGGTSYRKLAEKHGVPFSTLKEHARREKWTELRDKARYKADTKFANLMGEKQANRSAKINDVADMLLDKIIEMLKGNDYGVNGVKQLTSALKDIKDIKGVKSDIDLREQEARIEKLRKEVEEEQKDTTVKVEFKEEMDKWSK